MCSFTQTILLQLNSQFLARWLQRATSNCVVVLVACKTARKLDNEQQHYREFTMQCWRQCVKYCFALCEPCDGTTSLTKDVGGQLDWCGQRAEVWQSLRISRPDWNDQYFCTYFNIHGHIRHATQCSLLC